MSAIFTILGLASLLTGFILPFLIPLSQTDVLFLHVLAMGSAAIAFTFAWTYSE